MTDHATPAPEALAALNEADATQIWKALDDAHQTAIVQQRTGFGSTRALATERRQQLYNALGLLERLCSHMPSIRALAVTLKEPTSDPNPDTMPA